MPLYKCYQCGKVFDAAKPVCEACGIDAEADVRDTDVVQELKLHHFDPPSRRAGRGLGYAACDPKIKVGAPKCMFTGEPDAVNCPKCKATEVYVAANGVSNGAVAMKVGPLPK